MRLSFCDKQNDISNSYAYYTPSNGENELMPSLFRRLDARHKLMISERDKIVAVSENRYKSVWRIYCLDLGKYYECRNNSRVTNRRR